MTKSQLKYFQSLLQQKYRKEHKVFVVEGDKNVKEWILADAPLQFVVVTQAWADENESLLQPLACEVIIAAPFEMDKISMLHTPAAAYATVHVPPALTFNEHTNEEWVLVLDAVQDPGNLGTIIRIADWFGIKHIICGEGTVDVYNPKVVQATMGSLLRVNIYKAALPAILATSQQPVYITYLDGLNIHNLPQPVPKGFIVLGNESNGVSDTLLQMPHTKVTIPRLGGAESLNVGIATGIVCSHFIR